MLLICKYLHYWFSVLDAFSAPEVRKACLFASEEINLSDRLLVANADMPYICIYISMLCKCARVSR